MLREWSVAEGMTIERDEVIAGIAGILEEVCGVNPDEVTEDSRFASNSDGGLDVDSLSMVEVIVCAEEKWAVSIPDEEMEQLVYVRDLVDRVVRG